MMKRTMVVAAVALAACGTKRVNLCSSDADCTDPAFPFCDVNGEYPASGGDKNVCTVVPDNCPVDRCGCTPNAVLSCSGDQLTTCAADGKSTVADTCALGCAADGTRCLTFDPSNGLGGALAMAGGEPDVVLPSGAKIDTDTGAVTDASGTPLGLASIVVPQSNAAPIRAFMAKSLVVNDVTVTGSHAIALVATGMITVQGHLDVSAKGAIAGAGAAANNACGGVAVQEASCGSGFTKSNGGGGAGNSLMGGRSGDGTAGGSVETGNPPLLGGCDGGFILSSSGTLLSASGGGGGAIQIVSAQSIQLINRGFIDVGGGGGASGAGGGSGGNVVLEAPALVVSGASTGITANGGAGGGCNTNGQDAHSDASAATNPCGVANFVGGAGGTGSTAPGDGTACVSGTCIQCSTPGGGGGSVGRLVIATKDGTYASTSNPVFSVAVTTGILAIR